MKHLKFLRPQYLLVLAVALFFSASTLQASSFAVGVSVGIGYGGVPAKIPAGSSVVVYRPLSVVAGKSQSIFNMAKCLTGSNTPTIPTVISR